MGRSRHGRHRLALRRAQAPKRPSICIPTVTTERIRRKARIRNHPDTHSRSDDRTRRRRTASGGAGGASDGDRDDTRRRDAWPHPSQYCAAGVRLEAEAVVKLRQGAPGEDKDQQERTERERRR